MIFPDDIFQKLEFDKVLELIERNCYGELGKERVRNIEIHTSAIVIKRLLQETFEYKIAIEQSHRFPLSAYSSIAEHLKMLDIEGYVLSEDGLKEINTILLMVRDIYKFFRTKKAEYPTLYDVIKETPFDETLLVEINRVIDEKGEIRPDASPDLMKIRKRIVSKHRELDRRFKEVIGTYASNGWLSDTIESFRNGRRVLSVPSEHKRKIRGIIHDESATGKTAFIEPETIIEINNEIFGLEHEEKREIYRILRALSDILRPYTHLLGLYETFIARFDLIQAKANFAISVGGFIPQIKDQPFIGFRRAFHPLLLLKNKAEGKKTVPFSMVFHKNNRILVLSGPNAGGKSIAMKSVGLLQLMVQSGMLIPAVEDSEIGIFNRFYADIGDQQSLEDDLSTYSSRLRNAKFFVENATDKTLILIDEFGSGTDPKIGGAIAEAILKELNRKKLFGVITTHYSNLKMFAYKTKGIINGAMTFNKDSLSPTYQLKIGRPGSSYAYEIAQKSGLPKAIIKYARHKTGENTKAVDELLIDLQREKQELEDEIKSIKKKEEQLDRLVKNYERMANDLEFGRKKLKLDRKEQALQQTAQNNQEVERLIREIREEKNLEKAKKLATKVREERKELVENVKELNEVIYYKPTAKKAVKKGEIKIGDFVKLRTGGSTGKVHAIKKNSAIVELGLMKMTVKLRDLQHANEPLELQREKSVTTNMIAKNADFDTEIDIRGVRAEDAFKMVEAFVDEALVSTTAALRIIHGKGTGVLRKIVWQKLREYQDISSIRYEDDKYGGNGVTIVEID